MTKRELKNKAFNFLNKFSINDKIKTKFRNICQKTGQYNVPNELFQKRTSRYGRCLISWKTVKNNNLTLEHLETFYGGVVVEFINEDYFEEDINENTLFNILKNRLGSDEIVSSMISIRNENGISSSQIQRSAFEKLKLKFPNWKNQIIKRKKNISEPFGIGNEKWEGFVYVNIAGGQQDVIKSHFSEELIFNPACEYANQQTCLDIDLVMSYFALMSVDTEIKKGQEYKNLVLNIEYELKNSNYDFGNLYDYCINHPSLKLEVGKLFDPIQVEEIKVIDFAIDNKEDARNIDFTHDEAVNKEKFYYDNKKSCILTPTRPNNIFWSKHLSNMMQQNFTLNEYFKHEEKIVTKRKAKLQKQYN